MPMIASIATMIMKIITAITAITNAFSHQQSKKYFINSSQTTNIATADIKLPTKTPTTAPMIVPKTNIKIASVTFAFCPPTDALPTSQRIGATTIIPTTIYISNATKSILNLLLLFI
jgi:hypothetical protein